MKLGNKGFAITSIIYSILILFLALVVLILNNMAVRQNIFEKQKREILSKLENFKICMPVESSEYGNVPTGGYNYSDEYICNVDGTNYYHFYVLDTTTDSVSLIMANNYTDSTVPLTMSCDIDILNTYMEHIQNEFTEIASVTLPTKEQLMKANGQSDTSFPVWLCNNLSGKPNNVSNVYGYWTSSLNENSGTAMISDHLSVYTTSNDFYFGIRPVITIKKGKI